MKSEYDDDEQTDDESSSSVTSPYNVSHFGFDQQHTTEAQSSSNHHDVATNGTEHHLLINTGVEASDVYNSHFGLQEKIFEGFLVTFSQSLLDPHLEDLRFKIISNGGQFFDSPNDKVNIIIVPNSNTHEKDRIEHAIKYHLPIVYEQYVSDCLSMGTRLDWSQYCVPSSEQLLSDDNHFHLHSAVTTSNENIHQQQHNPLAPKFSVKLYVKGSRHTTFTDQFPEVLYTLTWKHKYDVRIVCSEKIFSGMNQMKILENIQMGLVMGYNDRTPVFTEEPSSPIDLNKQKKKKVGKKKTPGQPKKEDKSTVTISSVNRSSDEEIVIRFGINSLYCSKRFQYMPFRLCVKYAPQDTSDDYHFTVYSAEFKTFVKKDANISKYLNQPLPLNPTVKVITKACTTTTKVEYAKFVTGCSSPKQSGKKTKKNRATKKRKKGESEDEGLLVGYPFLPDQGGNAWPMNDMNMMYNPFMPLFPNPPMNNSLFPPHTDPMPMYPHLNSNTPSWIGEPLGVNVNGDVFYTYFVKDGVVYKPNDIVFVSPEDANNEDGIEEKHDKDEHDDRKPIEKYWVCKIINLVQTKTEGMRFIGQWFYRWCDLQGFGFDIEEATNQTKYRKHHDVASEKEIFVSFDVCYYSLTSLRGKCSSKYLDPETNLESEKKWLENDSHFFYQCGFNRSKTELFLLEEQMLKVVKENETDTLIDQHQHNHFAPPMFSPMPSVTSPSIVPGLFPGMPPQPMPSNPFTPGWPPMNPTPFPSFPPAHSSHSSLEPPHKKLNGGDEK